MYYIDLKPLHTTESKYQLLKFNKWSVNFYNDKIKGLSEYLRRLLQGSSIDMKMLNAPYIHYNHLMCVVMRFNQFF